MTIFRQPLDVSIYFKGDRDHIEIATRSISTKFIFPGTVSMLPCGMCINTD